MNKKLLMGIIIGFLLILVLGSIGRQCYKQGPIKREKEMKTEEKGQKIFQPIPEGEEANDTRPWLE